MKTSEAKADISSLKLRKELPAPLADFFDFLALQLARHHLRQGTTLRESTECKSDEHRPERSDIDD